MNVTPETEGYMRDMIAVLREAAAMYKEHPELEFDMAEFHPQRPDLENTSCRTPGCALGHYIHAYPERNGFQDIKGIRTSYPQFWGEGGAFVHGRDHFLLTDVEASELFDGDDGCGGAKTAGEAADYIEEFLTRQIAAATNEETA